ncbi:lysyl-tRNA synthetase, class 2 [Propionibacterium cyclohexanicum]|uniref:Lysyl-tRNA synthetase, class 2 n=1 Tax=Propionibacterium cyclohexanicum TaxID=64702 RepID=A0A1H9TUB7_9ACTN|nr:phosphatidylglycerol lysyltransferase domain-containing protein [Propionibacterium cyclohexanicum]SES00990.1 lysyl-tRNA synthetase, class 2 [Propionibacterium cyclohexanicum]
MAQTRRFGSWLTSPHVLAFFIGLIGVIDLASALTAPKAHRMRIVVEVFSTMTVGLAYVATAIVGVVLISLSRGLLHRKRSAWWGAVILVSASILLNVVKGLDVEEATIALVLLVMLLLGRRHFTGVPDPRSRKVIWRTVIGAPLAGIALGTVLMTLNHRSQAHSTTVAERVVHTALGMIGVEGPVRFVHERAAQHWALGNLMIGAAVVAVILAVALRSPDGPHDLRPDEETELRAIIAQSRRIGSLDYFATRRDRSVIFASSRRAAISYRVVGGVSLAGGDPLGEPGQWPAVIDAWLDEARKYGWLPGVLACGEEAGRMFAERGLDVLQLGDEAIIDVEQFTLQGRTMKPVRNVVNHAKRDGLSVDCLRAKDLSAVEAAEVRTRADAWRDGPVERGFSMALGRFGDPADGECVLVRARVQGELVGLLYMVPWGTDGLSLDLMRRKPDAPNGVVESMVAGLVEWGRDNRIGHISMNFAVLRDIFERGEQLGASLGAKVSYSVLKFASRFFQLDSLYRSNRKYQPRWLPRYICYGPGTLVDVGIAMLRAEAFLTLPSFGHRGPTKAGAELLDATGPALDVAGGDDSRPNGASQQSGVQRPGGGECAGS